jgi:Sec-independent protein translocase protein TatA
LESKNYTNLALGLGIGLGGGLLIIILIGVLYVVKTKRLKSKYESLSEAIGHPIRTENNQKLDIEIDSQNQDKKLPIDDLSNRQEKGKKSKADNNRYGKSEDSIDNVYADVEGE